MLKGSYVYLKIMFIVISFCQICVSTVYSLKVINKFPKIFIFGVNIDVECLRADNSYILGYPNAKFGN